MLSGAKRTRSGIRFWAPAVPGIYAVRMVAVTKDGSFTRDEIIEVGPSLPRARASAAAVDPHRERAFCAVVVAAREHGEISIALPTGGTFTAHTDRPAGSLQECTGSEKIAVSDGSTTLGSFRLEGLHGNVTLARGLDLVSGILVAPSSGRRHPRAPPTGTSR